MTRDEHLRWAKDRALAELERGDLAGAVASMLSDLQKHEAFNHPVYLTIGALGLFDIGRGPEAVRRWIEGFN